MIGLGKMGGNLMYNAVDRGYKVIGYSRSFKEELKSESFTQVTDLKEFIRNLSSPRVILMLIPAGRAVDELIEQLLSLVSKGDVIADCGNSYWGDSIRRSMRVKEKGAYFVDCGTSGGLTGARHGACFMVGGDKEAIAILEPILKDLAVEGGYVHAGKNGAGHFVKLVHNGIEFGMLQAIGEGMHLMTKYQDRLDLKDILSCWEHGSVIRSWLVQLMREQLEKSDLTDVPSYIEDTGEVDWLVQDAMKMDVPIPVIAQSVMQLIASRNNTDTWAKAIVMMRHGFGGHPFGEDKRIKEEREHGQVAGFYRAKDLDA